MAPKVGESVEEKNVATPVEGEDALDGEKTKAPDFSSAVVAAYTGRIPALAGRADAASVERIAGVAPEFSGQEQPCVKQTETQDERLQRLTAAADAIEEAANGGLAGIGTDEGKLWDTIFKLTPQDYAEVNEIFASRHGVKYAKNGEKWDIMKELENELNDEELATFKCLIGDKTTSEVEEQFRVDGQTLLKDGCGLKVGEMNEVTMPDGRRYDVYVPKNADSRAPVIVAMFGSAVGDGKGAMANESGLTIDAERTGSIVVFAHAKPRQYPVPLTTTEGIAWNVPGRTDMPKAETDEYDDRVYIDNVLADLGKRARTAEKVGMFGFSDGGRFAQVYAADRPDKVAGIVSIEGTWMKGDAPPEKGLPIMIIHGTEDKTLPYSGGFGTTSNVMDLLLGTNIDKSQPFMQAKIWSAANGYSGDPLSVVREGDMETRTYSSGDGNEVKEYILHGAQHGLHDYKNNGSRIAQWIMESPDRRYNFSLEGTRFLKRYITRDFKS